MESYCQQCGKALNPDLVVRIGEGCFCPPCANERLKDRGPVPALGSANNGAGGKAPKDRLIRTVFVMILGLMPGLGHMYLGLMNRGLQFLIGFAVGILVKDLFPPLFLIAPVVFFYSLFDLLQAVRVYKRGEAVADQPVVRLETLPDWAKDQRNWAFFLIFLGAVSLLQLSSFWWHPGVKKGLVAALLVGVGVWLLYGAKENGSGGEKAGENRAEAKPVEESQPMAGPSEAGQE